MRLQAEMSRYSICLPLHHQVVPQSMVAVVFMVGRCHADGTLIKASRLELSVWSEYFYRLLYRHQGEEITMEDVDPETLGTLVRAMFEKEVSASHLLCSCTKLPMLKFLWMCMVEKASAMMTSLLGDLTPAQ